MWIQNTKTREQKITNVPVFFLYSLDLMILIRENPLFRPLERVDPENLLFWAQKALASLVAISGPKKVLISRLTPSNVAIWAQKSLDFTAHPFQCCHLGPKKS
jgi:hypothetical protein